MLSDMKLANVFLLLGACAPTGGRNHRLFLMKRVFQSVDHLPASTLESGWFTSAKHAIGAPLALVRSFDGLSVKTRSRLNRLTRLTNDQVLLRLVAPERHLHGLWIPDSAKRQAYELWQGIVIATGPGDRTKTGHRKPMGVKVGDRCLFYSVGGKTATRWPSPEHVILSEEYIQCVLEAK